MAGLSRGLITGVLIAAFVGAAPAAAYEEVLYADNAHSSVEFRTRHWGIVDIIGWFEDSDIQVESMSKNSAPHVVDYEPKYSNQVADIYYKTIHTVNRRDYSEEQINAWAPLPIDYDAWRKRLDQKRPVLAIENDTVVGFGELEQDGHIDCFYVHSDHQRKGIGRLLMDEIERRARERLLAKLYAEVSITARPFFHAMDFTTVRENEELMRGVLLTNYIMEKPLN